MKKILSKEGDNLILHLFTEDGEFRNQLLEIELPDDNAFLKIKETLTRIGISKKSESKLFQSCHILHKADRYYIVHFKEMYAIDGRKVTFDEYDLERRNYIAGLLQSWNMCKVKDQKLNDECFSLTQIKNNDFRVTVIPHKEKNSWELISKYTMGTY